MSRPASRSVALFIGLLGVVALLVAACAPEEPEDVGVEEDPAEAEPDDPDEDEPDVDEDDDLDENEIRVVTAEDPPTLEAPYGYSATTGLVLRNIQEPLVGRDAETGEFVGLLAEDWEMVDDTTWHFFLREGVEFHDGSPFDAEAAAFSMNVSWDEEYTESPLLGFKGPDFEAEALDEHTLEIVTESPDPVLPHRLWMSPVFSQEHFEQEGEDAWREEPIGTGPYRFVEWDRANHIEIELNEDWWGHDDPEGADGEATIERAIYDIRPDQPSRTAAIQAGEAHLAERLPPDLCREDLGDDCEEAPNIDIAHIRVDMMHHVLGDQRIREAIDLAIDREAIGEEIVPGPPARMLVPEGALGYNPDIPIADHDPDAARELVEEARDDGVPIDEHPINIRIEREKFPNIDDAALAIQAMLEEVGLNTTFEVVDVEPFLDELIDPDRPVDPERGWFVLHQHSNRLADFHATMTSWIMCEAPISVYCNEEVDELANEAEGVEGDERHELLAEAAMLVWEDRAFIPVVEMGLFHGMDPALEWDIRADTNVYLKNMRLE